LKLLAHFTWASLFRRWPLFRLRCRFLQCGDTSLLRIFSLRRKHERFFSPVSTPDDVATPFHLLSSLKLTLDRAKPPVSLLVVFFPLVWPGLFGLLYFSGPSLISGSLYGCSHPFFCVISFFATFSMEQFFLRGVEAFFTFSSFPSLLASSASPPLQKLSELTSQLVL